MRDESVPPPPRYEAGGSTLAGRIAFTGLADDDLGVDLYGTAVLLEEFDASHFG